MCLPQPLVKYSYKSEKYQIWTQSVCIDPQQLIQISIHPTDVFKSYWSEIILGCLSEQTYLQTLNAIEGLVASAYVIECLVASAYAIEGLVASAHVIEGLVASAYVIEGLVASAYAIEGLVASAHVIEGLVASAYAIEGLAAIAYVSEGLVASAYVIEGLVAVLITRGSEFWVIDVSFKKIISFGQAVRGKLFYASANQKKIHPWKHVISLNCLISLKYCGLFFIKTPNFK